MGRAIVLQDIAKLICFSADINKRGRGSAWRPLLRQTMRVDDRNVAGVGASQSGKTVESRELERTGTPGSSETRRETGPDRVELSGLAGRLSRALSASSAERVVRVEQLTKRYTEGSYRVNSRDLSRAILAELRLAGPETPDMALWSHGDEGQS